MIKKVTVFIGLALLTAPGAFAHSSLVGSNPTDKSVVDQFPSRINLTFSENLIVINGKEANSLTLIDESNNKIGLAPVEIERNVISASVKSPPKNDGNFVIRYRVVSADGHPISGTINFALSNGANSTPQAIVSNPGSDKLRENGETGRALIIFTVLAAAALIAYLRFNGKK